MVRSSAGDSLLRTAEPRHNSSFGWRVLCVDTKPLMGDTCLSEREKSESALSPAVRYAQLKARLTQVGWISEGYLLDRGPGTGGPCYQWTRKAKGKTVSVALSREQFEWFQVAIDNWRQVKNILQVMHRLSRQVLFETVPNPKRRKRLGKRALGLI